MMSSMEIDSVKKLPNNETEILFPPGPAGFALEPVVRNGTRAIGATVTAFLPTSDRDVNLYRNSSPYPYPKTKSNFGDLASQHLTIGSVMQEIDGECVRNKSFDCIMVRSFFDTRPTPCLNSHHHLFNRLFYTGKVMNIAEFCLKM